MEMEKTVLGIADYATLAFMFLISAGIGIYYKFSGGKQQTTKEYFLADRDMSILPVALSLVATHYSATSILGFPADTYQFGIQLAYLNIGEAIGKILCCYMLLPVYFDMQAITVYEYLKRRFGKTTKTLCSVSYALKGILILPVLLYGPALALSSVTNLSQWVSALTVGLVCTLYCTLGGMKAVLWSDVFQVILMFLCIFSVIIKGFVDMGGMYIFKTSYDAGRLAAPSLELDLELRYTAWNILMSGIVLSMASFGGSQTEVQRMLTVRSISRSRTALFASIPIAGMISVLMFFSGCILYAYYSKCDPLTAPNKPISSADQLLPLYIISLFKDYSGLSGLCLCGIFSASLSSVSSGVNSLTAVTLEDLVKPFFVSCGYSQKTLAFIAKIITLLYGVLCIALIFVVDKFGGLLKIYYTITGVVGSPVLAVFLLGMMTTRANEKGVLIGLLAAVGITSWLAIGSMDAPPPKTLPVSVEGCPSVNFTQETSFLDTAFWNISIIPSEKNYTSNLPLDISLNSTEFNMQEPYKDIPFFYRISHMWYSSIGLVITITIGYCASIIFNLITGECKVPPENTLSPVFRYLLKKTIRESEKKL